MAVARKANLLHKTDNDAQKHCKPSQMAISPTAGN